MTRFNQILAGLFALQLVVAVGIGFVNRQPSVNDIQTALLTVDQKKIDRIVIDNGKFKKATLSKVNGKWELPDYHKLPASKALVDQILTSLSNTKNGWPVATTASSRERFEVSDDKFQTRIVLAKGDDTLETLYLGTSPGFRQLHLRRGGEDKVYTVKLNNYDFPPENDHWLDKSLLQPKGDIAEIQGPDFTVDKQGDEWKLAGADGEEVQKAEADKLANAVSHLSVQSAADKEKVKEGYALMVKVANDNIHYDFFSDGGNYFVKRDDYPEAFKISKADYEKITGETATQLVKHADTEKQHASANLETGKKTAQHG
jgi:hypothetical protein